MDRGRRAEPYSNATIWTREVAKNLASHLQRISNAHSCVDTKSPKSSQLPQFQNAKTRSHSSPLTKKKEKERQEAIESNSIPKQIPSKTTTVSDGSSSSNNTTQTPTLILPVSPHDKESLAAFTSSSMTAGSLDTRQEDDEKSHTAQPQQQYSLHHAPVKHLKPITKREMMENDRQEAIALENQRLHERLEKIAVSKDPKRTQQDGSSSYDTAAMISRKHTLNDANRKREQLKIYQENQALVKRLRNAKPTLKAKEWENHEKWNQEFLKKAEKRRQALQQELQKFQSSPQIALVKMKQLKSSHKKTASSEQTTEQREDEEETPAQEAERSNSPVLSLQKKKHLKSQSQPKHSSSKKKNQHKQTNENSEEPDGTLADTDVSSAAANHRRIMILRQQHASRSSSPFTSGSRRVSPCEDATEQLVQEQEEIVSVRFTFSRDGKTKPKEESAQVSTESKEVGEKSFTKTKRPLDEPAAIAVTNSDSNSDLTSQPDNMKTENGNKEDLEESGVYDVSFEAEDGGASKQLTEISKSEQLAPPPQPEVAVLPVLTDSTLTPLTGREEYEREEFDEATQDETVPDLRTSTATSNNTPGATVKVTSQEDESSTADYDNEFEQDMSSPIKVPTPRVTQAVTSKDPVGQEKKSEEEIAGYSQDEYDGEEQEEKKNPSPSTKVEEEQLEYSHDGFES